MVSTAARLTTPKYRAHKGTVATVAPKVTETEAAVDSDVTAETEEESEGVTVGTIIAIVILGLVIAAIIVLAIFMIRSDKKQQSGTRRNATNANDKKSKKK